jgi:hypothetical protein
VTCYFLIDVDNLDTAAGIVHSSCPTALRSHHHQWHFHNRTQTQLERDAAFGLVRFDFFKLNCVCWEDIEWRRRPHYAWLIFGRRTPDAFLPSRVVFQTHPESFQSVSRVEIALARTMIDANWIIYIFSFLASINCDSTKCWKSLFFMLFIISVTLWTMRMTISFTVLSYSSVTSMLALQSEMPCARTKR